jgi:hypothetical protein
MLARVTGRKIVTLATTIKVEVVQRSRPMEEAWLSEVLEPIAPRETELHRWLAQLWKVKGSRQFEPAS